MYATSVPDVAARAAGYGITGAIADGADVLGVYEAARAAVERARAGEGPTLLEVKTYRFRGHFEGDPDRYRDDEEREGLQEKDAIPPLRSRILTEGHATEADLDALHAEIEAAVEHAVEFARSSPFPDPADIGKYVYPEQITRVGVA